MKKILILSFLTLGTLSISGCVLIKQNPVDNSTMTEQITTLQQQISGLSSEVEILKIENQKLKEENETKKEYLLYYHNFEKDKAEYDWISFDKKFILPIKRNITISKTPIKDVFTLLFEANLTEDDLENGFSAGVFETHDFTIKSIVLDNGVLKIDFMNQNFSLESLSSAESSIFVNSVRKTALQFPEIEKIQFQNDMIIGVKNPNDTQM